MIFTLAMEDELIAAIEADPAAHHRAPDAAYRSDGKVLLTRDKLRVFLHRELYRRLVGELADNAFLLRECDDERCVNPLEGHRRLSRTPRGDWKPAACGHVLTKADEGADGKRRCRACKKARAAAKPKRWEGLLYCPAAHPYDEENTYRYKTKAGNIHRKCRTCTLARRRGIDPTTVTTAILKEVTRKS